MTLWVLLFVSMGLASVGGPVITVPLPKSADEIFYETQEECQVELKRIKADMDASYPKPEDQDYLFRCQCIAKEGASCPKEL